MKMIFALLSLFTSSAMAVTMVQQNLNPTASQNEINGTLDLGFFNAETDDGTKADGTAAHLFGTYYYGINDTQAIGLGTGYQSSKSEVKDGGTSTAKGFDSFSLLYKGNFDVGTPTLFVQGGLSFALEESKSHLNTDGNSDNNASSGSNSVKIEAGLVFPAQVANWGFSGGYQVNQEGKFKRTDDFSADTDSGKTKGGDAYLLSGFMEFNNDFHPNAELIYTRTYGKKNTSDDGTFVQTMSGYEILSLVGTLRVAVNENVELQPHAGLTTFINKQNQNLDQYLLMTVGLTGRFLF